MLEVAIDIERAMLGELGMSLDIEAPLLRAGSGIAQRVSRLVEDLDLDALAVLHVDGGAGIDGSRIGEREAVKFERGFVGAGHVELAVGGGAGEVIGDLGSEVGGLGDAHVRARVRDSKVAGDVAGHGDRSGRAVIGDLNRAVCDGGLVHEHLVDVGEVEDLAHRGERCAIGKGHRTSLFGGEEIGDLSDADMERLRGEAPYDKESQEGSIEPFHCITIV